MQRRRAFDGLSDEPCPVCRELAEQDKIQFEAVLPLPKFPAMLKLDGRKCCRDCVATETTMRVCGNHLMFGSARLTIANERIEGLRMPLGMMEHFGLCMGGYIEPCSVDDLKPHHEWLERHGIGETERIAD